MPPVASTSRATPARELPTKGPLNRLKKGAGRVAKEGNAWAKRAGEVLREDGTRFVQGAGKVLKKGGQVVMACAATTCNTEDR